VHPSQNIHVAFVDKLARKRGWILQNGGGRAPTPRSGNPPHVLMPRSLPAKNKPSYPLWVYGAVGVGAVGALALFGFWCRDTRSSYKTMRISAPVTGVSSSMPPRRLELCADTDSAAQMTGLKAVNDRQPMPRAAPLPNWLGQAHESVEQQCPNVFQGWPTLEYLCDEVRDPEHLASGCLLRLPAPTAAQDDAFMKGDWSHEYLPSQFEEDWIDMAEKHPSANKKFYVCGLQHDPRFKQFFVDWVKITNDAWRSSPNERMSKFMVDCDTVDSWKTDKSNPMSLMVFRRKVGSKQTCMAMMLEPIAGILRHPSTVCSPPDGVVRGLTAYTYLALPGGMDPAFRAMFPGRRVLVDLGASVFFSGESKFGEDPSQGNMWFQSGTWMDMYRQMGLEFDLYLGWEVRSDAKAPDMLDMINKWDRDMAGRVCWANRPASTVAGHVDNAMEMLAQLWRPGDYFVFKLDVDTPSVEIPLVREFLLKCPHVVQEFVFEFHVPIGEMMDCCWGDQVGETYPAALRLFQDLRKKGIVAHFWT
jgi:hypothetical protein